MSYRRDPAAAPRLRGVTRWLDTRFRSPAAIYGLIVFAAFLSVDSDDAHDVWELLRTALLSLLIFFLAHVFAHTLTDHGERGLARATGDAVQHAAGMLYAALPASVVLVLAALQEWSVDDAYGAAMWVTVAVLAVLGYVAYWRRGAHVLVRLLGSAGTAALGVLIIMLEYAIH